ncbi:MAG: hypothetical protein WD845_04545, partial [Pirellulales bacterium]
MNRWKLQISWSLALALMASVGALPSMADGTNTGSGSGNNSGGGSVFLPSNIPPGQQNLTPEQLRSIMVYRALQSRGSGQVRRGVPQFVPFGSLGFDNSAQTTQGPQVGGVDPAATPNSQRDANKEAARQKRIETLKA